MNKKMRVFPEGMQNYEKVFTAKRYISKFRMDKLQKPHGFDSTNEYKNFFRKFLIKKSNQLWCDIVCFEWLLGNYNYASGIYPEGYKHNKIGPKPFTSAFDVFIKEFVGVGHSFLTQGFYFKRVRCFFEDFFPNFYKGDPFKNPEDYAFPFKNITIDYLVAVYQMPERIEILKYADKHVMPYGIFLDFLINYIGKYNDMEGRDVFLFVKNTHFPPYVKDTRQISVYGKKYD